MSSNEFSNSLVLIKIKIKLTDEHYKRLFKG